MPFTIQSLAPHPPRAAELWIVVEPSGTRLEIPPLSQEDATQVAEWLNVTCEVNAENEDVNYDV